MARQFSNFCKLVIAKATTTSEAADATTDVIDTAGYKGIVFLTSIGTANATNTMTIQQSTATDATTFADLASTKVSSGTNKNNLAVDICRPTERYVRAVIARGAATAICPVWAILYGGDAIGDSSVAAKLVHEFYYAPAEGTA